MWLKKTFGDFAVTVLYRDVRVEYLHPKLWRKKRKCTWPLFV